MNERVQKILLRQMALLLEASEKETGHEAPANLSSMSRAMAELAKSYSWMTTSNPGNGEYEIV